MHTYVIKAGQASRGAKSPRHVRARLRTAMSAGAGGREHSRHRGFGRLPGGGVGGLGFAGFGSGGGPWRARRARRGDIRTAALILLSEEPRNGYQIMQEVQARSGGLWSPSPGSVYPALAQLQDEGLVRTEQIDGRELFALTDAGREELAKRDPARPAPWEELGGGPSAQRMQLGQALRAVAEAAVTVIRTGSDSQIAQAQQILSAARRDLYRLLADEAEGAS